VLSTVNVKELERLLTFDDLSVRVAFSICRPSGSTGRGTLFGDESIKPDTQKLLLSYTIYVVFNSPAIVTLIFFVILDDVEDKLGASGFAVSTVTYSGSDGLLSVPAIFVVITVKQYDVSSSNKY
jgi:hypothetical protein